MTLFEIAKAAEKHTDYSVRILFTVNKEPFTLEKIRFDTHPNGLTDESSVWALVTFKGRKYRDQFPSDLEVIPVN